MTDFARVVGKTRLIDLDRHDLVSARALRTGSAPYLYVLPWGAVERGGFWNAESFTGAILAYADLVAAADQRQAALDFFRKGQELLKAR